jgi:hypothetical protein
MKVSRALFDYLAVLAVIQPARIQDIETYAPQVLPSEDVPNRVKTGVFRVCHDQARELDLVIPVKRGTYFLTEAGREIVRRSDLHKEIDNMRLFLMKAQRRRYK